MAVVYSNNASTALSSGITNSATSITVGSVADFPVLTGSDYYYATLANVTNTKIEIVKVTAAAGTTLTVVRGQDNTTAVSFDASDNLQLRVTAATLESATSTDVAITGGSVSTSTITDATASAKGLATAAQITKLDAIEASADVTDTANVTASGALMDSEVTNLAQVKAFDTTDYATSTQGTTADNALPKAGGAMTGTIAGFTSTGIDDNATSTKLTVANTGINVTGRIDFDGNDVGVQSRATHSGTTVGPNMPVFGRYDIRDPEPSADAVNGYCRFGFTSYNLNNTSPWADSFMMNSYTDASGGSPNMFVVNKNGSGVKVARGGYGSTSNFKNGTIYTLDYTSASDERVKENVQNITGGLTDVLALRPVTFEWTDEYILEGHSKNATENQYTQAEGEAPVITIPETKTTNVGFIAQEVEEVVPTVVHQDNIRLSSMEEGDHLKNIAYEKLVPYLVSAIKEQQDVIDGLKARIEALEV